jgi:hypothetical protein
MSGQEDGSGAAVLQVNEAIGASVVDVEVLGKDLFRLCEDGTTGLVGLLTAFRTGDSRASIEVSLTLSQWNGSGLLATDLFWGCTL